MLRKRIAPGFDCAEMRLAKRAETTHFVSVLGHNDWSTLAGQVHMPAPFHRKERGVQTVPPIPNGECSIIRRICVLLARLTIWGQDQKIGGVVMVLGCKGHVAIRTTFTGDRSYLGPWSPVYFSLDMIRICLGAYRVSLYSLIGFGFGKNLPLYLHLQKAPLRGQRFTVRVVDRQFWCKKITTCPFL